jgi:thioredoxin reductase (NADPH)
MASRGLTPNSSFMPPEIERDEWGFVITDETLMTTLPGVFAAGLVNRMGWHR